MFILLLCAIAAPTGSDNRNRYIMLIFAVKHKFTGQGKFLEMNENVL